MNPCRCGHALEDIRAVAASQNGALNPIRRASRVRCDRIDLHLEVGAIRASDLILPPPSEGSAEVAARVSAACDLQRERFRRLGHPDISCNAAAPAALVEQIVVLDEPGIRLVRDASEKLRLSARGFHRVLKLARTIADLHGADHVRGPHLAEALSYRAGSVRGEAVSRNETFSASH